jgi:hypothetical protein
MKTKMSFCICAVLIASSASAVGQVSQGNAASSGNKDARIVSAKRDLLTTTAVEKAARVTLAENPSEKIVANRFALSGPLVTLATADDPLTEFNPFAVSPAGASSRTLRLDPYLPPPRGFVLLRIRF